MVKKCEACQFHAKQIRQPAQELQTIPLTWPFTVWGLDILGPFPRAQGGYRYLNVAIDKFTKWVEVEPVCTISTRSAVKFIHGLLCRFGVPNRTPIEAVNSPADYSRSTMHGSASRFASPPSLIPGATARPSVPMMRSSRASK
jgi:hypothetical protein